MQKDDYLDNETFYSEGSFQVTNKAKGFLATTAFWGKIVSIAGFILTAIIVLAAMGMLFMGSAFSQFSEQMGDLGGLGAFGGVGIAFVYILGALFYFFPSLYLFNFSQKTQAAIRNSDSLELENAFENLKSLYKFIGIWTVIILGIYGIIIVFALIAGAVA